MGLIILAMKHVTMLLFVLLVVVSSTANATVVSCALAMPDVIASLGEGTGNFCNGGGFTSGNFRLGSAGFNSVTIGLADATMEAGAQSLKFNIATDPDPVLQHGNGEPWLRFYYTVSADDPLNLPIKEVGIKSLVGSGILMIETACKSDFAANYGECPASDLLGEIGVRPGFTADIDIPTGVDLVYLRKGVYFDDAHIASVVNYVGNEAPEPVTLGMIGAGLVGLAVLKKRKV